MKNNQKGFGVVGALIVIAIVALIGFAGWYIWQKNSDKNNSKQTNNSKQNKSYSPKENEDKNKDEYLDIKEWGVRFKLNDVAKGAYYSIRDDGQYADIYHKDFDALKNTNGVPCKGEVLFVVGRYDDTSLEELTNREKISVNDYVYTGTPAHQAPPECAVLNAEDPSAEAKYDQAILDKFTKYKMDINDSFKSLKAVE